MIPAARSVAGDGISKRTSRSEAAAAAAKSGRRADGDGEEEMEKPRRVFSSKTAALLAVCLVLAPALLVMAVLCGEPTVWRFGRVVTSTRQGAVEIQAEESCDLSVGKWVREPNDPLYTNLTCPTIPNTKNCQKYGKDPGHLHWRWQPAGCDLPRFSPERFLAVVRGKSLAFIGDSLARNQMDSLLCLLSQFFVHATAVVGADGKPVGAFYADVGKLDTNWTLPGMDVHLDRLSANWSRRLPELDYAVVSGGNWLFRVNYLWNGGRRVGCVNCRDAGVPDVGVARAHRRMVRAALGAVAGCRGCKRGLVTLLRTYSPDHFEGGTWFRGGYCNRTRPLEDVDGDGDGAAVGGGGGLGRGVVWELRRVQVEEVARARKKTTAAAAAASRRFEVLDVTNAMMSRADGHPGWHHEKRRLTNDCLHWCLPGPVDTWNEMLLQRLLEISPPTVVR
ncbi:hypothetical protein ACP4OV_017451 [Aristida adscensionis]